MNQAVILDRASGSIPTARYVFPLFSSSLTSLTILSLLVLSLSVFSILPMPPRRRVASCVRMLDSYMTASSCAKHLLLRYEYCLLSIIFKYL